MKQSRSGFINRALHSHVGHVLLAVSWCFILFVMVRPLHRPFFADCIPSGQEVFWITEVNIAYPIWTVIIACAHFPSILFTRGVLLVIQRIVSLSCSETAKVELAVFFISSSIQWLLVGFGLDSVLGWMKSRRNHRRIQQALGADSP